MKKTYGRCLGVFLACGTSLLWATPIYAQTPPDAPTSTASALPEPPPPPPHVPTSTVSALPEPPPPPPSMVTPLPTNPPPVVPIPSVSPAAPVGNAPTVTPQAPLPTRRPSMWGPLVDGRIREVPYWYGKDLGLVLAPMDVGTVLLFISGQDQLQAFGAANFVVAHLFMGPIFHWAYGYTGRGFGALALNTMLPILGGLTGAAFGSDGEFFALTGLGILGAQAIDVFLLAEGTQRVSVDVPRKATWRPTSVGIMPWFDSQRTGLSVIGQF